MSRRLLNGYEAAEAFYDLFFEERKHFSLRDYLDNSFCDEMAEVNLKQDTSRLLYHVEGKYLSPTSVAEYRALFEFARDYVIHPDDRGIYVELMDPDHIAERQANAKHPGFRFGHFRYKLTDGTYRYVEQVIISGRAYGLEDGVFRFYVFDVQNVYSRFAGQTPKEGHLFRSEVDDGTGLLTKASFEDQTQAAIDKLRGKSWCIVALDVEHFKLFDEWYGRAEGDLLIARIGSILHRYIQTHKGIAGYFGADDFALFVPYDQKGLENLYEQVRMTTLKFGFSAGFRPAFGIYMCRKGDNIRDAIDHATSATNRAKKDFRKRIHIFDPEIQIKAEEEYRVLLDCMRAMQNNEITFYLQPQCRISNRKIVGIEALCRWIKPDGTRIPPDVFIPVLEKYGFITDLDKYLWEKVVISLKHWLDAGHKAVPISVNVSRIDIATIDIADYFDKLCKKYGIDHHYIKIEITESAYTENTHAVSDLVSRLRDLGFLVLMDDFGSGYSSLNMLGTLSVDAIKLDAMFLNLDGDNFNKSVHIVESIVNMAKIISLPIIVEGVETQSQIDFLSSIGCRYVQGYYFYKPMPREEFEQLIQNSDMIDDRGFVSKSNEQFRLREFLDENVYSDAMLNNILGPVGVYTWKGEEVNIVRFNQQFYEAVGVPDFAERLDNIARFCPKEDVPLLLELLRHAKENRLNGSTGVIHFYRTDGSLSTFFMNFYFLGDIEDGYSRFYCSCRDLTELSDLREQMSLIAETTNDTLVFLKIRNERQDMTVVANGLQNELGLTKEALQQELSNSSFWNRISSRDSKAICGLVSRSLEQKEDFHITFRIRGASKNPFKLELSGNYVGNRVPNVDFILTFHK